MILSDLDSRCGKEDVLRSAFCSFEVLWKSFEHPGWPTTHPNLSCCPSPLASIRCIRTSVHGHGDQSVSWPDLRAVTKLPRILRFCGALRVLCRLPCDGRNQNKCLSFAYSMQSLFPLFVWLEGLQMQRHSVVHFSWQTEVATYFELLVKHVADCSRHWSFLPRYAALASPRQSSIGEVFH